jgi:D-aminopeptidase
MIRSASCYSSGITARAGSFPGIMAHTISYGAFKLVRLGGEPIGEPDFFAIRAGELGRADRNDQR